LIKALFHIYPEVDWKILKFQHRAHNAWNDIVLKRAFFKELGKEFNIQKFEDWYKVPRNKLVAIAGTALIKYPIVSDKMEILLEIVSQPVCITLPVTNLCTKR
jgi:hypothetical protein